MNITVTKNQVSVDTDYILNDKEYNVNQCYFTFSDEYTDDLVKKAIFVQETTTIEMSIINNQCQIPAEVLNNGQFELRVYAYEVDGDELLLRYSPSYTTAYVRTGSYIENAESPEVITPTQFEQYMQAMNDGLNEVANVDIDAEQTSTGGTVTITNRYGEEKTVEIKDGEKGETGATPNIQIGTVVTGDHSEVTRTGTNENPIFNFILEKGDKGDTGNGIASVTKTSTSGLVDTYTITYTNGTTTTFNVTNGKSITNIAKTSTSGLEDTYTITYNDNTTSTFTVENGNGISSIEKTGTQDNVDTYTIYYTNGTTSTFTVTNSTVTNQEFEELKAEHEELVNTLPRVEGTGESITLDNTTQYNMNVALNPSELSQITYIGRNKANFETIDYSLQNSATGSRNGQEYTITCSADNKYGSCRFSATNLGLKLNTTYTFSALVKSTTSTTGSYLYVYGGATSTGTATSGSKVSAGNRCYITFTTPDSWGSSAWVGLLPSEEGATTVFTDVMIEESSTMGEYEPFVGGYPSPSPLYPQPIKKVTGNNSITVFGTNMIDQSVLLSSLTYNPETGYYGGTPSSAINSTTSGIFKENTRYTVKWLTYTTSTGTNKQSLQIKFNYTDGTETHFNTTSATTPTQNSFTSESGKTVSSFQILYIRARDINIKDLMLYEGTDTTKEFEPYQSQTYPINLPVTNLFDKNTATYKNGYVKNADGEETSAGASGYLINYIELKPNVEYTISGKFRTSNNIAAIYCYDASKNWISKLIWSGYDNVSSFTFTTPSNCHYIQFQYIINVYDENTVQICEGTTITYWPYGTAPIELCKIGNYSDEIFITKGKNLFMSEYVYTPSQTKNANLAAGTYTFSMCDGNVFGANIYFKLYDSNDNIVTTDGHLTSKRSLSFSTTSYAYYGAAGWSSITFTIDSGYKLNIGVLGADGTRRAMLVTGNTIVRDYEPYGIGNWYIKRNIGKVVLDGTEPYNALGGTTSNPYYVFYNNNSQLSNSIKSAIIYSNYFIVDNSSGLLQKDGGCRIAEFNSINRAFFCIHSITNVNDFKTWLTTHNTTVYYILATPTSEAITDTTLINQLNNLYNQIKSYKGQTNITQTNDELPFNIDASALYDLNNLISRVATLEVEV